MGDKVYMVPNPPTPNVPIQFDAGSCSGCNLCVEVCPTNVLMPNPEKKNPPIVLYSDECWYCGSCVEDCPRAGSIRLVQPLQQSIVVRWKRKETGEYFRLGMKNPPPPNTRPPAR
jgi:NAD-dependent dihydropyrimidine dehydrogenase PreA subunit